MIIRKIGPVYTATLRLTARPGTCYYATGRTIADAMHNVWLRAIAD